MDDEKSNINLIDSVLDNQIKALENYNMIFKDYISEHEILLNTKFKNSEELRKIPVAASFCLEDSEIPLFKGDEVFYKAQDLLKLFNNSTYLGLYSFLESRLKAYCRYINIIYKKEYDRGKMKGDGYIEKDINYLISVFGNNFAIYRKFPNLNIYSAIRHSFTHNASSIVKDTSKPFKHQIFYTQIDKMEGISINEVGMITIISSVFFNNFCDFFREFLTGIAIEILKMRSEDTKSLLYKKN